MSLTLAACENVERQTGGGVSSPVPPVFQQKISLDEASFAEVSEYVETCRGKKLCVLICHRPPGNPGQGKNRLLPLNATLAHLNHGGGHEEKDYLGPCAMEDAAAESDADEGSDVAEEEDPVTDHEIPEDEIPVWCQEVYAIDGNCDGLEDDTGAPIF